MVDEALIASKIKLLEEYLRDLTEARKQLDSRRFASDKIMRRYVERTLHLAIEACLDIANHIISYEGYREPSSNRDTFQVLSEQGVISDELCNRLMRMAQFRNLIVHDYARVDPAIVYSILTDNVGDIVEFAQTVVERFLETPDNVPNAGNADATD